MLFICVTGFLSACTTAPVETPLVDLTIIENVEETFPELSSEKFGQPQNFESEDVIMTLSEVQKTKFLDYYYATKNENKPGHQRLYEYLQEFGDTFTYGNFTSNAQTTLASATGNCMSLAVLTTALARTANIEIRYQLVNRIPVYQEYGSVIFNAQHIRSLVYEPRSDLDANNAVNIWSGRAVIDYYPSKSNFVSGNVSKNEFMAMYYRNLASESIAKNENQKAFWLLKRSLEEEPESAQTINSLAVLYRRVGDYQKSEDLYKYGIKHAVNKITLLKNYRILLQGQERFADARKISKELENLDDYDPFNWLHAANDAYEENDLVLALKLYKKSIELAPYLHQGYFGIAKTELKRGNKKAAKIALETAQDEAFDVESKSIYEAKLIALSKEVYN